MVNLGFCSPCFKAGRGRKDAARMHGWEGLCLDCLKAAGVEVLAPPVPSTKVQAPLRRVVAKAPSVTFPARVQPVAAPLVKRVVDAFAAGGERKTTVKMLPAMDEGLCTRGCGKARHRGLCAGQGARNYAAAVGRELPPAAVVELEAPRIEVLQEVRMDKLVAEYVRVEDVPGEAKPMRKPMGRMGGLWMMLERAPAETPRVRVKCLDVAHAGYTSRQLRAKAEKLGRSVAVQRCGTDLYCWLEGGAA